ncbi:MAG: preprotein translocase subunit YajC [Helicobacteraceae bacterium]
MQSGSFIGSILPIIVIFAIFYFLLILPQQKQQKRLKAMQDGLKKGDKILMNSGIIGVVNKVEEEFIKVEIAPECIVRVQKEFIAKKFDDEK